MSPNILSPASAPGLVLTFALETINNMESEVAKKLVEGRLLVKFTILSISDVAKS